MKTFWHKSLLIFMVSIAVGCAGPQTNMSFEERLVAHGYPPDYVEGLTVGAESVCADISTGKFLGLTPPEISVRCLNILGKNSKAKSDGPRNSRSYQQGVADGEDLGLLEIQAARNAEFQRKLEWESMNSYPRYQDIMRLENVNK